MKNILEKITSSLKKHETIASAEKSESSKDTRQQFHKPSVESCTISAEEIMSVIEASLKPVDELKMDKSYKDNERWAEVFGILTNPSLNLKELTLLSMKLAKPRKALDLIADILSMNIPIDALEAVQNRGKTAIPDYKAISRMLWEQIIKRLTEPISIQKEIYKNRKVPEQSLLTGLVLIIMKNLSISINSSGLAAIFALMIVKIEFNTFSEKSN